MLYHQRKLIKMQTPEKRLINEIKLYCGQRNWLCYHCLNGIFYTKNGGIIKLDFPVGFPDLMILTDDGRTFFIETKIKPRKPTAKQVKFQANLRERGFISGTVYKLGDFVKMLY